jgi:hypothetical protein
MRGLTRRRPRDRADATMRRVLDLKPDEQAEYERRGDPFPPQPEWTDEALAALNVKAAPYDGQSYALRPPLVTQADEAAEDVGRFTQQVWHLARQGRFSDARRFAAQWGTPRRPQQPPGPADRDTQPWRRDTGPQPPWGRPYAPGSATVSMFPRLPVHPPLPDLALAPILERRAAVARERLDRLPPPLPYDGLGHEDELAEYMQGVGRATGTHTAYENAGAWPKRTTDAGGPVPVRRGLAIAAAPGKHAATGPVERPAPAAPQAADPEDPEVLGRVLAGLENLPGKGQAA